MTFVLHLLNRLLTKFLLSTMFFINENYGESKSIKDNAARPNEKPKNEHGTQIPNWSQQHNSESKFYPTATTTFGTTENQPVAPEQENSPPQKKQLKQTQFDKALIAFVKKNTPLWDKGSASYHKKHIKMQLWQSIATILNMDVGTCILRWKVLKDKYVKHKLMTCDRSDGEKVDFMEELNFLDKYLVNQNNQTNELYVNRRYNRSNFNQTDSETSLVSLHNGLEDMASDSISETEFREKEVPLTTTLNNLMGGAKYQNPQRKNNSNKISRKIGNDNSNNNGLKVKPVGLNTSELGKDPEDLFGELVASLLKRSPEEVKTSLMMEIMSSLLKY